MLFGDEKVNLYLENLIDCEEEKTIKKSKKIHQTNKMNNPQLGMKFDSNEMHSKHKIIKIGINYILGLLIFS